MYRRAYDRDRDLACKELTTLVSDIGSKNWRSHVQIEWLKGPCIGSLSWEKQWSYPLILKVEYHHTAEAFLVW